MVLSSSQHIVVAFTVVLFTFVVLPRMFGVGTGTGAKETRGFDSRFNRKVGPGPSAVRGQPSTPGSAQSSESMQQMKMMMEQEMKGDKYKTSSNKGYVFTLMPLYAIGVGVFAAYKFLKIKSAEDSQNQKSRVVKGEEESTEAEKQLNELNELEQRLAQTERMLNSILGQLDPLTSCVKSVAQEQKKEIVTQLQTIRHLMKKRGMDCPPINIQEASCERNLDKLIESLATRDPSPASDHLEHGCKDLADGALELDLQEAEEQCRKRETPQEDTEKAVSESEDEERGEEQETEDEADEDEAPPTLQERCESNVENIGALAEELPVSVLRRRNRPE